MSTLLRNPLEWSRLRVGTSQRFWVNAVSMMLIPFLIIYLASTTGWTVAIILAALLCLQQFKLIYALRLLVLEANAPSDAQRVA
jgi:hypothetical protein